jgi:hypothetical protein
MGAAAMSYSAPPAAAAARRHKENAAAAAASSPALTSSGPGSVPGTPGVSSGPSSLAGQKIKGKKRGKGRRRQANVVELGRFKPTDDLALINAILQVNHTFKTSGILITSKRN